MKKIIITGGLGYIGMELCKIFSGKSRQLDITVIDNNFASSRVSQLKRWGIKFKQIDILDSKNLEKDPLPHFYRYILHRHHFFRNHAHPKLLQMGNLN